MSTACRALFVAVGLCLAASCGVGDPEGTATTTAGEATTSTVLAAAAPPTTTTTTSPAELLAAGVCPTVDRAEPDPDRPRYTATVDVDPATGQVEGTMAVGFTPDLDLDEIVFRLWPNSPRLTAAGVELTVAGLRLDGEPLDFALSDPTTLRAPLAGSVEAATLLRLEVDFTLAVPGSAPDRVSRLDDSLRLGSFLPLLPWVPGEGWALDPPTALFAEAATSPTADYEVTLRVPDGYDVLATGVPDGQGTWTADAVRDFAASVGHFEEVTRTAHAPDEVVVTVGVHAGLDADPEAYAGRIVAALEDFGTRYGPYPWPVLTVAMTPGLEGGIEFPTHIMQGPDTLGRTTPHEVGHQWFYGLVGNNQGAEPWLDEGLASYAEAVFESTRDDFARRSIPGAAAGRLDEPLTYWADHADDYYAGVYVQGAQAVNALGTPDQVDCVLRNYVDAHAFALVDSGDLLATAESLLPGAAGVLAGFGVVD